ncbi:MAG: hypothetical protein ACNA7J_14015, partial [Wenzhouxiangella sp.]
SFKLALHPLPRPTLGPDHFNAATYRRFYRRGQEILQYCQQTSKIRLSRHLIAKPVQKRPTLGA